MAFCIAERDQDAEGCEMCSVRYGALLVSERKGGSDLVLWSAWWTLMSYYSFSFSSPSGSVYLETGLSELAIYTIRTWCMMVLENVHLLISQSAKPEFLHLLVGQSAKPEFLQKLTYLCWNHHKAVRHIDTMRAYTFGSQYFVDVDIVLLCDMPLQEAHNIGEALQEKLESWSGIESSFVHLDYEFTHQPEHARPYGT